MPYRYHHRLNKDQKALLFGLFLVSVFLLLIIAAFSSSGPLVLGTEKNTNGMVEYLCLGRDCERLF